MFCTSIFAQVTYIDYIDTNYIKPKNYEYAGRKGTDFNMSEICGKQKKWEIHVNNLVSTRSLFLYDHKQYYLILKTTDSIHKKNIVKHHYPNGHLKEIYEETEFLKIDSSLVGCFEPELYQFLAFQPKFKCGFYSAYYENGTKQSEGTYFLTYYGWSEYKVGKWIHWYENGNIKQIENYIKEQKISIKNGKYQEFYESGKLKMEGNFGISNLNEDKIQEIRDAFEDTNTWNIAIKEGEWKEYDENGNLKRILIYENNRITKEVNY